MSTTSSGPSNVGNGASFADAVAHIRTVARPDGGSSFLVAPDVLVTCAHVLGDEPPQDALTVTFPALADASVVAQLIPGRWYAPDAEDVAFLRLAAIPSGARPLPLGSSRFPERRSVGTYGFPAGGRSGGHYAPARAGPLLGDDPVRLELTDATALARGFSGSPVVDEETGLALGMVTEIARPDPDGLGVGIAYAVPAEMLCDLFSGLELLAPESEQLRRLFFPHLNRQCSAFQGRAKEVRFDPQRNLIDFYVPARGAKEPPPKGPSPEVRAQPLWEQLEPTLSSGTPCIVLADFGMGKTWFLEHVLYELSMNRSSARWIPLMYRLRGYRGPSDPLARPALFPFFGRQVPRSSFDELRILTWIAALGEIKATRHDSVLQAASERGQFIYLLDALDEIALGARPGVDGIITDLGRLANSAHRSPVLVTCRRSFFQDSAHEASLRDRGFEVFYLWPWSTEDIFAYLCNAHKLGLLTVDPHQALKQLSEIYDLRDLASRALLSAMLVDQWDEVMARANAGAAHDLLSLYEIHIEKALLNWQGQKSLRLEKHEVRRYMEEIAFLMLQLGSLEITASELDTYFERTMGKQGVAKYSEIASDLVRDIKTNALLVRESDSFSFCHTSIWEFFVARRVYRSLSNSQAQALFVAGRTPQYTSIVRNFLAPTLLREGRQDLIAQFLRGGKPDLS